MIYVTDIGAILIGFVIGVLLGFYRGMKAGKQRFWRMPASSWNVRR